MEERKIIFSNLLNGVPLGNVCKAFNKSESEIQADFKYIMQKVKNYCFLNGVPTIVGDSVEECRKQRHSIFPILKMVDLNKSPIYKITNRTFNGEAL